MNAPRPGAHLDLHLHTDLSDGRYPPEEVLERCAAGGLEVVALTDHDLAVELEAGPRQTAAGPLHLLGGAEISGVHEGEEYHLLVYFSGAVPEGFRRFCRMQAQERAERYDAAVRSLDLRGLSGPDARARRGERSLTRHHIARALVASGHATSVGDAFSRHVGDASRTVPRMSLPFVDAIRIAREHGGITSWAHPPLHVLHRYAGCFAEAGLQGLEGIRPRLSRTARKQYKKAVRRHRLFLTGGSDWHGWLEPELGLFTVHAQELRGFLDALAA